MGKNKCENEKAQKQSYWEGVKRFQNKYLDLQDEHQKALEDHDKALKGQKDEHDKKHIDLLKEHNRLQIKLNTMNIDHPKLRKKKDNEISKLKTKLVDARLENKKYKKRITTFKQQNDADEFHDAIGDKNEDPLWNWDAELHTIQKHDMNVQ